MGTHAKSRTFAVGAAVPHGGWYSCSVCNAAMQWPHYTIFSTCPICVNPQGHWLLAREREPQHEHERERDKSKCVNCNECKMCRSRAQDPA